MGPNVDIRKLVVRLYLFYIHFSLRKKLPAAKVRKYNRAGTLKLTLINFFYMKTYVRQDTIRRIVRIENFSCVKVPR